jgi:hypothetical protein
VNDTLLHDEDMTISAIGSGLLRETYLVKPALPSPVSRIMLNPLDVVMRDHALSFSLLYAHSLDIGRLRASLAKALAYYPAVCGRLRSARGSADGFKIDCLDAPIPLTVVGVLGLDDGFATRSEFLGPKTGFVDANVPLLHVQVTKYTATGHCALSVRFARGLCDGASIFDFLRTWSKLYENEEPAHFNPTLLREYAPESLKLRTPVSVESPAQPQAKPPCPYCSEDPVWQEGDRTESASLSFSRAALHFLKRLASGGAPQSTDQPAERSPISTQEALSAYLFNSLYAVCLPKRPCRASVVNVVDLGHRVSPPFPVHYFGNATALHSSPLLPVSSPLPVVAREIRNSLTALTPSAAHARLSYLSNLQSSGMLSTMAASTDLHELRIISCARLPIASMTFGGKLDDFELDEDLVRPFSCVVVPDVTKAGELKVVMRVPKGAAHRVEAKMARDVHQWLRGPREDYPVSNNRS